MFTEELSFQWDTLVLQELYNLRWCFKQQVLQYLTEVDGVSSSQPIWVRTLQLVNERFFFGRYICFELNPEIGLL